MVKSRIKKGEKPYNDAKTFYCPIWQIFPFRQFSLWWKWGQRELDHWNIAIVWRDSPTCTLRGDFDKTHPWKRLEKRVESVSHHFASDQDPWLHPPYESIRGSHWEIVEGRRNGLEIGLEIGLFTQGWAPSLDCGWYRGKVKVGHGSVGRVDCKTQMKLRTYKKIRIKFLFHLPLCFPNISLSYIYGACEQIQYESGLRNGGKTWDRQAREWHKGAKKEVERKIDFRNGSGSSAAPASIQFNGGAI